MHEPFNLNALDAIRRAELLAGIAAGHQDSRQDESLHIAELRAEALDAAVRLALVRRRHYLQDKGRKLSPRAIASWMKKQARGQAQMLLDEAASLTTALADRPLRRIAGIAMLLWIQVATESRRPRGRPRIHPQGGLLPESFFKNIARLESEETENRWQSRTYGLKLRLYARGRGLSDEITLSEAQRHLRLDPDRPRSMSITDWLDKAVPDSAVVAHRGVQGLMSGSPAALAKRLQRARVRRPYRLPCDR